MRPPRAIPLLVVLCASLAVLPVAARQAPKTTAPALTDVRGLWVLRTSLTSAKSITAMVSAAKAGGFNTLLVQVRGRGEAFYTSAVEPPASELDAQPASFDPLALPIELPTTRTPVALISSKDRSLSPVAKLFAETARVVVDEMFDKRPKRSSRRPRAS